MRCIIYNEVHRLFIAEIDIPDCYVNLKNIYCKIAKILRKKEKRNDIMFYAPFTIAAEATKYSCDRKYIWFVNCC